MPTSTTLPFLCSGAVSVDDVEEDDDGDGFGRGENGRRRPLSLPMAYFSPGTRPGHGLNGRTRVALRTKAAGR